MLNPSRTQERGRGCRRLRFRLSQRLVNARLPPRPRRAEAFEDFLVETQAHQLLGLALWPTACFREGGADVRGNVFAGLCARKICFGPFGVVAVDNGFSLAGYNGALQL